MTRACSPPDSHTASPREGGAPGCGGTGSAPLARRRGCRSAAQQRRRPGPPGSALAPDRLRRPGDRRSLHPRVRRGPRAPSGDRRRRSSGSYTPRWSATACSGIRSSRSRAGVTGAAPTASWRSCGRRESSRCSWCSARRHGRTAYPSRCRGTTSMSRREERRSTRGSTTTRTSSPRRSGATTTTCGAGRSGTNPTWLISGARGRIPSLTARSTRHFGRRSCAWTRRPRSRSAASAGSARHRPRASPASSSCAASRGRGLRSTPSRFTPMQTDDHPPWVHVPNENNFDNIERVHDQLVADGERAPIWVTEWGWSSASGRRSAARRCTSTGRWQMLEHRYRFVRVATYFVDHDLPPSFFQGLLDEHLKPKPAAARVPEPGRSRRFALPREALSSVT